MDRDPTVARRPAREEEALAEIAATRVRPRSAAAAILLFSLALAAGPVLEPLVAVPRAGLDRPEFDRVAPRGAEIRRAWRTRGWSGLLSVALQTIDRAEARIDRHGALARLLRPPVQRAFLVALRHGNAEVVVGRDGWLFLRSALEHTTGPGFLRAPASESDTAPGVDAATGLIRFQRELEPRGVRLLVMPVPEKEQIHPERLVGGRLAPPVRNRDYATFVARLRAAGVAVYDPGPELAELARGGEAVYLATDTHWTPAAVDQVAERLAHALRAEVDLPPPIPGAFTREPVALEFHGDLAQLLGLSPRGPLHPRRKVATERVLTASGEPFDAARASSPVLLLADSFSLVFSRQGGGLQSAGLPDQLAYHLGFPIRLMGDVRANSLARRIRWLGRGFSRLGGTRILVYQFAARDLSIQDWTPGRAHLRRHAGRPLTARKPRR